LVKTLRILEGDFDPVLHLRFRFGFRQKGSMEEDFESKLLSQLQAMKDVFSVSALLTKSKAGG
jgi:hypothetical protein